jgi:hypothetical protein
VPAADEAQSGDAVAAMIAAITDPALWFDADADFLKDSAKAARRIEATRAEAVALGQLAAQAHATSAQVTACCVNFTLMTAIIAQQMFNVSFQKQTKIRLEYPRCFLFQ